MKVARVTSKGQVTIPVEIRRLIGISRGDELIFEEQEGVVTIRKVVRGSPFDSWAGYLDPAGTSDELVEEMRGA